MRCSGSWTGARLGLATISVRPTTGQHFRKRGPFAKAIGEEAKLLSEGAVDEAVRLGLDVRRIFVVREADERPRDGQQHPRDRHADSISPRLARHILGRTTPAGERIAQLRLPPRATLLARTPRRVLVIDGVQEPANVAALVRAAVNFGWAGEIWAVGEAADPYSLKAMTASDHLTLRASIIFGTRDECRTRLTELGVPVLVAGVRVPPAASVQHRRGVAVVDAPDVATQSDEAALAIVLSAEGAGADDAWAAYPRVVIPLNQTSESLNVGVAGAILMHALRPTSTATGGSHQSTAAVGMSPLRSAFLTSCRRLASAAIAP